ncbi:M23 family metallopeptidase [Caenimonas sedimenti]|uniref:M23 family metallopeptidase n=1 Tax=Caenimonas sedimenti TaxID=2596921 RepID=A0A562ZFS3_9BURK|nr:M23 family metallopeptidase [Caenimonas sedimenti]TWO66633.1 M23 family metallopeptidase [Caenimonas sedimenti]
MGYFLAFLLAVMAFSHSSMDGLRAPAVTVVQAPAAAPPPATKAPAPAPAVAKQTPSAEEILAARQLVVPVQGIPRSRLKDTFDEGRGKGRAHRAIDIMAPWGTPVLAADDGQVTKISSNRGGGLSVYQTDASGRFLYYYAHLAGYAEGLHDGQLVRRGEVIGYVGATGNAPDHAPHLHFAVQYVESGSRWAKLWGRGEAVNPYLALALAN